MKELKAVEILLKTRAEIANPIIVTTEDFNKALAELQELTQEKSCKQCALICIDGEDCDLGERPAPKNHP